MHFEFKSKNSRFATSLADEAFPRIFKNNCYANLAFPRATSQRRHDQLTKSCFILFVGLNRLEVSSSMELGEFDVFVFIEWIRSFRWFGNANEGSESAVSFK